MGTGINLTAIYIANLMGLLMAVITLSGNWMMLSEGSSDGKLLKAMLYVVMASCIVDPLVFACDGREGTLAFLVVYIGNLWLYFSNILLGPLWVALVSNHAFGGMLKWQKVMIGVLCGIGVLVLLINFFTPIAFGVDESNCYFRGPAYFLFAALEVFFLAAGIVDYYISKIKGGVFKFFPVWLFIIPAICGAVIQSVIYGTSTTWPCVAISIMGILSGLRNEATYRDRLTGLYNRYYLEHIKEKVTHDRKAGNITVMMMDLNDFKTINDTYGHPEGDEALRTTSGVLRSCVGANGSVIRYGGDEFVVLMNTQSEITVKNCIDSIHSTLQKISDSGSKPYRLSLSIGVGSLNLEKQTFDELIGETDRKMYEEKAKYYTKHDRRRSAGR